MDFSHELGQTVERMSTPLLLMVVLFSCNTGEILDKTVFSYDDVARIYEETDKLHIPLDAI